MSKISAIEILSVFLHFVFAAFCPLFAIWLYIMFQNPTSMLLDFFTNVLYVYFLSLLAVSI